MTETDPSPAPATGATTHTALQQPCLANAPPEIKLQIASHFIPELRYPHLYRDDDQDPNSSVNRGYGDLLNLSLVSGMGHAARQNLYTRFITKDFGSIVKILDHLIKSPEKQGWLTEMHSTVDLLLGSLGFETANRCFQYIVSFIPWYPHLLGCLLEHRVALQAQPLRAATEPTSAKATITPYKPCRSACPSLQYLGFYQETPSPPFLHPLILWPFIGLPHVRRLEVERCEELWPAAITWTRYNNRTTAFHIQDLGLELLSGVAEFFGGIEEFRVKGCVLAWIPKDTIYRYGTTQRRTHLGKFRSLEALYAASHVLFGLVFADTPPEPSELVLCQDNTIIPLVPHGRPIAEAGEVELPPNLTRLEIREDPWGGCRWADPLKLTRQYTLELWSPGKLVPLMNNFAKRCPEPHKSLKNVVFWYQTWGDDRFDWSEAEQEEVKEVFSPNKAADMVGAVRARKFNIHYEPTTGPLM
ncbi:hypothetical protein B0T22DRAFT_441807 [Podospora appendiculata]|uniref:Uncharacterized protein n=1 Tax=Podospora appendiculata TaxID=314037 RepID=A0AAE0XD23_9PEZI|nr:hypothetical protein B0T22DRAFT_441807 [Podospora appendiculata]